MSSDETCLPGAGRNNTTSGDLFGLYPNRSPSIKSNQAKKILSWILLCRCGVVSSQPASDCPLPPGSNMLNWVVSRFTPSPRVYETSETYLNAPTMSVFIVTSIGKDQTLPALLHQHHVGVAGDVRDAVPHGVGDIWDLSWAPTMPENHSNIKPRPWQVIYGVQAKSEVGMAKHPAPGRLCSSKVPTVGVLIFLESCLIDKNPHKYVVVRYFQRVISKNW